MELFRLAKAAFARSLSGKGAAAAGGRWSSRGVELIYTAANRSLAMAEVAVHATLATLPDDYRMVTIDVPDRISVLELASDKLPRGWNNHPPIVATQQLGDTFIAEGTCCLLRVPSAVTQGDFNFLINPHHPDFERIRIVDAVPFPFDSRIFR